MVTWNSICNREKNQKAIEFKPVPDGCERFEPAEIDGTTLPLYKRLWLDPRYFRWITTAVWAVGVGVTFGILGDFSMFFIFLEREFEPTISELSWLGALPWVLCCFFSPLATLIVHWAGFRSTMVGACFLAGVGLFSTSFVHALWPAFLSYSLLFGGSCVVFYTAGCVYVSRYFDKKHCTGPVSSNGLAYEAAILIFSPVIQATSNHWGWRWSVRFLSFFSIALAFLFLAFIRQPPTDMFNDDDEDDEDDDDCKKKYYEKVPEKEIMDATGCGEKKVDMEEGEDREKHWKASARRYFKLLKMPSFLLLIIGITLSITAVSFNHINFGSYLTSVGISDQKTAILHSFLAGSALVGRISILFIQYLPFSILLTYPIIGLICCAVSVLVILVSQSWVFYVYAIAMGLMRGMYFSLATGLGLELSGKESAAEAYALVFFGWGSGSALAAVVPGITHQLTGSYRLSMIVCAALWGISAILFTIVYLLNRRSKRKRASSLSSNNNDSKITDRTVPLKDVRKNEIVTASYTILPMEKLTVV